MKLLTRLSLTVSVLAVSGSAWAAGMASAASVPGGLGAVTVTVTPTILVSKGPDGKDVTVGTIVPSSPGVVTSSGDGSSNVLLWTILGLLAVLIIGALAWWLLTRNKRPTPAGTQRDDGPEVVPNETSASSTEPIAAVAEDPDAALTGPGGATAVSAAVDDDHTVEDGHVTGEEFGSVAEGSDEPGEDAAGRHQR